MIFPQTVDELLHWDVSTDQDSFGTFQIITGFEGIGGCFWCGKELEGHRRFCGHRSGHWTLYANHFYWGYARAWCFERYDYACANCGHHVPVPHGDHPSWYTQGLEAHHIIPLEGGNRSCSVFNVPWNLICFCHYCHLLIHALMRESSQSTVLDVFDLALARGQFVFNI